MKNLLIVSNCEESLPYAHTCPHGTLWCLFRRYTPLTSACCPCISEQVRSVLCTCHASPVWSGLCCLCFQPPPLHAVPFSEGSAAGGTKGSLPLLSIFLQKCVFSAYFFKIMLPARLHTVMRRSPQGAVHKEDQDCAGQSRAAAGVSFPPTLRRATPSPWDVRSGPPHCCSHTQCFITCSPVLTQAQLLASLCFSLFPWLS